MNAAHLHLLINHVAVLGVAFGLGLGVFGLLLTKHDLVRAALIVFILSGAATIVTYYSGESAEEMVEHAAGISESVLESHEDAAKPATVAGVVLAVAALIALIATRRREPGRVLVAGILTAALGVSAWNMYVANLGGGIRHPEIHAGWTGDVAAEASQERMGMERVEGSEAESESRAERGERAE